MTTDVRVPEAPAKSRRWPRLAAFSAAYGAAGLALLVPTSTAGAAWYLADQLLDAAGPHPCPVRLRGIAPGVATLSRTDDLARPIPLGFTWPGGHFRLGDIVDADRASVVRAVTAVDRGEPRAGIRGYTCAHIYGGDPTTTHGLPFTEVAIPGELGDMPAWLIRPTAPARDTWVVAVHGRQAPRAEVLRILPTLAAAGLPTLAVSYRNDHDAPASPDRCYHLGGTEWRDVAAAVRYARSAGARDVILYGWSMGGAIVLNLLRRAPEAGFVRGIILDCPVVDWVETVLMHARALNVPKAWTWTAMRLVQYRLGTRLVDLDHRPHATELRVPTLMFVDHDDPTVAPAPALEYAASRPDLVTLVETRGAGHCRSWNLDPQRYEAAVAGFLGAV